MSYAISRHKDVTVIWVSYCDELEQDFLLTADRHWDNPFSDHNLQVKHLKQAAALGAGVLDFGDFFCAMQGKYDPRASKDSLRPEHKVDDYFDALVDTAVEFFNPYKNLFILIAAGNHETSIRKRHEIDLTKRLVKGLGGAPHVGGYTGWVQFRFMDIPTSKFDIVNLWYTHGYGGGGPVTKGVIQTARRAAYNPDAQIIVTGHIHEDWALTVTRQRLMPDFTVKLEPQLHVQVPTYKDEFKSDGWTVERGSPPKPIGARWLRFRKSRGDDAVHYDAGKAE